MKLLKQSLFAAIVASLIYMSVLTAHAATAYFYDSDPGFIQSGLYTSGGYKWKGVYTGGTSRGTGFFHYQTGNFDSYDYFVYTPNTGSGQGIMKATMYGQKQDGSWHSKTANPFDQQSHEGQLWYLGGSYTTGSKYSWVTTGWYTDCVSGYRCEWDEIITWDYVKLQYY
jgi:hypothetical protein